MGVLNPKAVIFDMDGTLLDSEDLNFELFNLALNHFKGRTISKEEFMERVWGVPVEYELKYYFSGISLENLRNFYRSEYAQVIDRIKIKKGALDLLRYLKTKQISTGIATNTHASVGRMLLDAAGILHLIDCCVFGDEIERPKPHPDMLLLCCKRLGVDPESAIYVGDTPVDMEAGQRAGIFTVGLGVDGGSIRIESLVEMISMIGG